MSENSSLEQNLENIVEERASDLRWTKTIYFKMASYVKMFSKLFDLVLLFTTGALTAILSQGWLTLEGQLILAAFATTLALVDLVFDLDKVAYEYDKDAEMYNSLLKEFEEYYFMVLMDEDCSVEQKKSKLEELTARHRNLNETTPPTWDFAYRRTTTEDLGGTMIFDETQG